MLDTRVVPEKTSPMMQQYFQIKTAHPDAFLFFRLGDFYELFGDDAVEAAKILEITLTARSSGEGRSVKIPMCGVPHHAADQYIQKLLARGRKVAVVEQMEDPQKAKGMVKRELVRIITPGTKLIAESLIPKKNNFLSALDPLDSETWVIASADVSTGECKWTRFQGKNALEDMRLELFRLRPSELLIPEEKITAFKLHLPNEPDIYLTPVHDVYFDPDAALICLRETWPGHRPAGENPQEFSAQALGALGALLHYIRETQRGILQHLRYPATYDPGHYMTIDPASLRNLEIFTNTQDFSSKHSLLSVMDETLTAMGGRKMYQWLLRPLLIREKIERRHEAVEELMRKSFLQRALRDELGCMYDVERLTGKLGANTILPRDLAALRSSLQKMPRVQTLLRKETSVATLQELAESLPDLSECSALLESALQEHPASTLKEGGVIRPGFDRDLDTLRSLSQNSKQHLGELLTKERSRTGIGSLKIEYNSVFGYYIEITKTHLEKVPMDYERKQTLVNAERFITPELKILEAKILRAEEQAIRLESELFDRVRQTCARFLQPLLRAADLVAELDVYLALATTALRNHYVRPQMHDGFTFSIKEGRHPVVENMAGAYFVPNDTYLENDENQLLMITGPNMAGKSTYLRQNALIPIMAQMGGFVPAKQADLCIVDKVFTRVGAADHLALGQSTFMVEMSETAHILRSATPRSLIILDEVGRGTSTFDGVSIAWAIAEHIHDRIGAKTLFATHYFELTELSLTKPKIKNYTVLVKEQNETIQFLRKILPGQTDRSYGIQVARLAGLPQTILNRAKEILHNLENANYTEDGKSRLAFHEEKPEPGALPQKSLYPENLEKQGEIVTELLAMDLDRTNGMEALQWLHRWRERLSTRD